MTGARPCRSVEFETVAGPADGSLWAMLVGSGSVLGIVVSKGFDYLKVRRREASGDRRSTNKEWGALLDGFKTSLAETKTEVRQAREKAESAEARIGDCEKHRAECEARLAIHETAIRELGMTIGVRLLEDGA